ncbi:hypothetical protein [Rhodopirellula halodulae]|uniref:hypothetical protein n=1 Tax=Rhodopirellula halodulae TaxID=2894198 RepID=UPI001E63C7DC|nr:hypothetical protein [Rhodopirellula sp. JC737]MCC9655285.1 hypothetical protein [Rhodopirellula sp. JC737]
MHTFSDHKNVEWNVEISILDAKRLKENGFDMMDFEKFSQQLSDIFDAYEILWHIVKDQAESLSIDAEEFAKRYSKSADSAYTALVGAVTDFSQRHGKKAVGRAIARVWEATNEAELKRLQLLESKTTTDAISRVISQELEKAEKELDKMGRDSGSKSDE